MIAKLQISMLLVLAVSLTAQAAIQQGGGDRPAQAENRELFFDVNFVGGTVNEYVEMLRVLNPNVRILCAESAGNSPVPPIKIKGIPTAVAVNALMMVSQTNYRPIIVQQEMFEDQNRNAGSIFTIDLDFPPEKVQMEATVVSAQAALRKLGSDNPAEKLQQTIETGLATVFSENDGPAVVVKLHKETGLLFVRGRGDQVQFVVKIIDQLSRNLN